MTARIISGVLACSFLLTSTAFPRESKVYRWTDERGAVHITGDMENVPEKYRAGAVPMRYGVVDEAEDAPVAGAGVISGERSISFDPDNAGIKVTALFDGETSRGAWVDTGSEIVTITTKLAAALGYDLRKARKSRFSVLGGAVTAPVVTLKSVKVGGASVRDVTAAVIDFEGRGPVSAIIGMNFLSRFSFEIDMKKGVIAFSSHPREE